MTKNAKQRRLEILHSLLGRQGSAYTSDSDLFMELLEAMAKKLNSQDVLRLEVFLDTANGS